MSGLEIFIRLNRELKHRFKKIFTFTIELNLNISDTPLNPGFD